MTNNVGFLRSVGLWALVLVGGAGAADWPQFRGPGRDGIWQETGIRERFSLGDLPVRWRAKIGPGYTGPTVADGRVFVMDRQKEPNEVERVLCYDAATGSLRWTHTYACTYGKVAYPAGPRASVTVDGDRAFSLGATGQLFCLEVKTGRVLWHKDGVKDLGTQIPIWGIAASPLVEGDLVICQMGGQPGACIVAFDKTHGQERWRALDDKASYSSPLVIEQAGKRVLVCWTGGQVAGLDPKTGRVYWGYPFPPKQMVMNVPMPVPYQDRLFMTAFFEGSLLLRLDPNALRVDKVWQRRGENERNTDSLHCCIATPIIKAGHVYGVDSYGELRCLDLATGDRVWSTQEAVPNARWANAHLVQWGDKTWLFNEKGELILADLSTHGYREISRARIIEPTTEQLGQRGGVCWSHPAFANKCIYVRNDNEMICVDLAAKE